MPVAMRIEMKGTAEEITAFMTELAGHRKTTQPKPAATQSSYQTTAVNRTEPPRIRLPK